jgi:hypothetical protein
MFPNEGSVRSGRVHALQGGRDGDADDDGDDGDDASLAMTTTVTMVRR